MLALKELDYHDGEPIEVDPGAIAWWLDFVAPMRTLSALQFFQEYENTEQTEELDQIDENGENDEEKMPKVDEIPDELPLPASIKGIPTAIRKLNGDDEESKKKRKAEKKKQPAKKKNKKKAKTQQPKKKPSQAKPTKVRVGQNYTQPCIQTTLEYFIVVDLDLVKSANLRRVSA